MGAMKELYNELMNGRPVRGERPRDVQLLPIVVYETKKWYWDYEAELLVNPSDYDDRIPFDFIMAKELLILQRAVLIEKATKVQLENEASIEDKDQETIMRNAWFDEKISKIFGE